MERRLAATEQGQWASSTRLERLALALAALTVASWWLQAGPHLADPPVGAHAWRETDGLIVARNFCEEHTSLFEPHVDNRGDTPGRTGMELPVLNAFASWAGCAGGDLVSPWRTLGLCLAALGCAGLAFVAWRTRGALEAALVVLVFATAPLTPYFSRATQPDAAAMGLVCVSLALSLTRGWVLAPVALCLAGLVKGPAIAYAAPVLALLLTARASSWRGKALRVGLSLAALGPVFAWYGQARALEALDGLTNFRVSRPVGELLLEWTRAETWSGLVWRPFDVWVFPGVTVVAVAALALRRPRLTPLGAGSLVAAAAYVGVCGYAGVFHDYYGLLLLPLLALGGGWGLAQVTRWSAAKAPRVATVVLVAFTLAAMGWQVFRARGWWAAPAQREAWARVTAFCEAHAPSRLVVFTDGSPEAYWFAHRRGAQGLVSDPQVPAGQWGFVDRTRIREGSGPVEQALVERGCAPRFANEVAWLCEASGAPEPSGR